MFAKTDAKSALCDFIAMPIDELEAPVAFGLMVDFFASTVPDGAVPEDQDGDMLLYEWGTFDWGQGPAFTLSLRRQIIYPDGPSDQEIWQLAVSYEYEPRTVFKELGQGEQWCASRYAAADFKASFLASPVVTAVRTIPFRSVDLTWEAQ